MFLEFVGGLDIDRKIFFSNYFPASMRFGTRWNTLVDSGPCYHFFCKSSTFYQVFRAFNLPILGVLIFSCLSVVTLGYNNRVIILTLDTWQKDINIDKILWWEKYY